MEEKNWDGDKEIDLESNLDADIEEEKFQRRKERYLKERRKKRKRKRICRLLCFGAALAAVLAVVCWGAGWMRENFFTPGIDIGQVQVPDWVVQDFLTPNPYSRSQEPVEEINGVVIHYVGNPGTTAKQNRSYFEGLKDSHETYASSTFIIDLDGTVIQCVPLNEVAFCSNKRNKDTVSIECCHPDETGTFTQETYDSLIRLTAWLCDTFELEEEDVLRHYDVTQKLCPLYMVENPQEWEKFLSDVEVYRQDNPSGTENALITG